MKSAAMKRIILKAGEERRILMGHPWVYDNEAACIFGGPGSNEELSPEDLVPGELADIEGSPRGKPPRSLYLGRGFVNPHSKIIARLYSPSKEGIDKGFFKRRIREALARRNSYDLRREPARIIFGEADFLPGLIVDRFVGWPLPDIEALEERPVTFEKAAAALGPPSSWIALQFLIWGMDARREMILEALGEVLEKDAYPGLSGSVSGEEMAREAEAASLGLPRAFVEKPALRFRELEGLPPREALVRGDMPSSGLAIFENGFPLAVHLEEGQKTGHFLDQNANRLLAAGFASGARVLDAFAYTGAFGIHAARMGALSVTAVDSSAGALETAALNARLNAVEDRFSVVEADVFDFLKNADRRDSSAPPYDLIILDPPAFAKSRSALEGALRGYKEINLRAVRLLRPGGVLVSCSCSHALDEGRFRRMIAEAASDAERRLYEIGFSCQAPDHPVLAGYDESRYLKCGIYKVVS